MADPKSGEVKLKDALESFKSKVWTHFGFYSVNGTEPDKDFATCKKKIRYTGSTTNMHSHLVRHHPELTEKTVPFRQSCRLIHPGQRQLHMPFLFICVRTFVCTALWKIKGFASWCRYWSQGTKYPGVNISLKKLCQHFTRRQKLRWRVRSEHVYPHPSKPAYRHLCVPGTSVSVRRVFSTAGDILSMFTCTQQFS